MSSVFEKNKGLFGLPDDVWVLILTDGYLILRDIARFDIAIGDRELRVWLLSLIRSPKCEFLRERPHVGLLPDMHTGEYDLTRSSIYGPLTLQKMMWLVLRRMHVASLFLPKITDDEEATCEYFARVRMVIMEMLELHLLDRLEIINIHGSSSYMCNSVYLSSSGLFSTYTKLDALITITGIDVSSVVIPLIRERSRDVRCVVVAPSSSTTEETSASFESLCIGNRRILSLTLDGCDHIITDASLGVIAENLPGLRYISLAGNSNITKSGINVLVTRCRGLEHIVVRDCMKLCNEAMHYIGANCSELEYIDVFGCNDKLLTNLGIGSLAMQCLKLKKVCQGTGIAPLYLDVLPADERTEFEWFYRLSLNMFGG